MDRAERRRQERRQQKSTTYWDAYVPDPISGDHFYLPPFTALTANGVGWTYFMCKNPKARRIYCEQLTIALKEKFNATDA